VSFQQLGVVNFVLLFVLATNNTRVAVFVVVVVVVVVVRCEIMHAHNANNHEAIMQYRTVPYCTVPYRSDPRLCLTWMECHAEKKTSRSGATWKAYEALLTVLIRLSSSVKTKKRD
jgi:hypothetical protein